jgi:CDP-diacylglycerol---glycerol-3-phosphate 3-phosphatidyltransferase
MRQGIDREKGERRSTIRQDVVNLPNLLTMLRIVMIPLVLWFIYRETRIGNFWAVIIFALTALTDVIDGWLARMQGLTSVLGKFLDPLADKLIILASLVAMVEIGRVPAWVVILIVGRELCVTSLRTIAISEGLVISAGQGGKDKAALQNVAVSMLILHDTYDVNFWFIDVTVSLHAVGLVMLYTSLIFALTSAGEYVRMFVGAVEVKEQRGGDP